MFLTDHLVYHRSVQNVKLLSVDMLQPAHVTFAPMDLSVVFHETVL